MKDDENPGPTGEFPRGQLNVHDEGQVTIRIGAVQKKNAVIIEFGAPVKWIGFSREEALGLAEILKKHADNLSKT